jgi:hypothetical protein
MEILEELEQREAQARLRRDLQTLNSLWSDQLVVNSAESLLLGKEYALERLRTGRQSYEAYDRHTLRVCNLGPVQIAIGDEEITTVSGDVFRCYYMNVWQLCPGGWKLAARQVDLLDEMPPHEKEEPAPGRTRVQ